MDVARPYFPAIFTFEREPTALRVRTCEYQIYYIALIIKRTEISSESMETQRLANSGGIMQMSLSPMVSRSTLGQRIS